MVRKSVKYVFISLKQTPLLAMLLTRHFKHFNSMGHNDFLNNVSITLIDKTDGRNPRKREDYWRRTLKTY